MIKAIPANFTLDELMAYLREEETPEGFFTLKEWGERLECSELRMLKLLKEAKRQGVLDLTKVRRERLDGVMTPVPGYRFDVGDDDQNVQTSH